MVKISEEVIESYALDNAIKHGGKADVQAVLSGLFAEGLKKNEIKNYLPVIQRIVGDVNLMDFEKQKQKIESLPKISKRKVREGLPELPNVEKGKVVMRMAPFPSGPLHIGNARTLILNDEYVKVYNGKLILVMDDTIGSEEKQIEPDAYNLIIDGVNFLKCNYDKKIVYKSDRFDLYLSYAEELIKKGYMYVCECSQEKMRELRTKGIECPCRNIPPSEQLKRWEKMFNSPAGSMSVRLKTSMQDSDPAFRDRVMMKISDRPHPKTGTKYRIYPTLDFSWAIDDHLLGITHVLRGVDLMMETRTEKFIWDIFEWKYPEIIYNGFLSVEGVKISKSKSAKEVKSGEYKGWNDPRTWSLQSLRDRGIQPEAIRQFIVNAGINKANIKIPVDVLYSLNKKIIGDSPRYFFVEMPRGIKINGCPHFSAKLPLHPSIDLGFREYTTTQDFLISKNDFEKIENGNYRLMHLLNFKSVKTSVLDERKFSFISVEPSNDLNVKFIQWLPANAENIRTKILMPDGKYIEGLSEPKTKEIKTNSTIQFERFGFVCLHKKNKDELEFWFTHN